MNWFVVIYGGLCLLVVIFTLVAILVVPIDVPKPKVIFPSEARSAQHRRPYHQTCEVLIAWPATERVKCGNRSDKLESILVQKVGGRSNHLNHQRFRSFWLCPQCETANKRCVVLQDGRTWAVALDRRTKS